MLELKLIIRSIKKQYRAYSIYFASIIIVVILMVMYLNFLNSINIENKTEYNLTFLGMTIVISLCLLFIIMYGNKMMRKLKASEYGFYKLLGITYKKLFKIMFLEQIIMLIISFIIGYVIGTILTFITLFLSNMSIKEYIPEGFSFKFSPGIVILMIIILFIIGLITTIFNYRAVRKQEVVDLLQNQKNLNPAKQISNFEFLFYLINTVIIFTSIIYLLAFENNLLNTDEIFIMVFGWILAIYMSYKVAAYLFIKMIPKNIIYKKDNVFIISQITRRLSSNIKSMTFITIFLVILFVLIFFGVYLIDFGKNNYQKNDVEYVSNINNEFIKYKNKDYNIEISEINWIVETEDEVYLMLESQYNDFAKKNQFPTVNLSENQASIITDQNEGQIKSKYTLEPENYNDLQLKVLLKDKIQVQNIQTDILIISDKTLPTYAKLYQDVKNTLEKYKGSYDLMVLKKYYSKSYKYFLEFENVENPYVLDMMTESDINKYYKALGKDEYFDLKLGEFGLVGTTNTGIKEVKETKTNEQWEDVGSTNTYKIVKEVVDPFASVIDKRTSFTGISWQGIGIISDEQAKEIKKYKYKEVTYILNYKDQAQEQDKMWQENANYKKENNIGWSYIFVKTQVVREQYMFNMIILSITIYITFILFIILIAMLALHSSIDSIESQKEFEKLKRINYSNADLKKSVNKITATYFIIPFIISLVNVLIFIILIIPIIKEEKVYFIINFKAVTLIYLLLLIIYILFYILINYTYKKIVGVK